MKLEKILENINYELLQGSLDIDINDIKYDSREVVNGDLFVCLTGYYSDGHDYIETAIEKGATALLVERDVVVPEGIAVIKVENSRKVLNKASKNFFRNPDEELIKIGITGTKGKTTTTYMIKSILEKAGNKVGMMGTVGIYIGKEKYKTVNTTPESYVVYKYMRKMIDEGCKYVVMEVSSLGLKHGRVDNIMFDYGVFTNLSLDHVSPDSGREHPTYEDYANSKKILFNMCKVGIFNKDNDEYKRMVADATCEIITFGKKDADVIINNITKTSRVDKIHTSFELTGRVNGTFDLNLPGEFNVYNATVATIVTKLIGIEDKYIEEGLLSTVVDGRCQLFNVGNKFNVMIDFAHNLVSIESIINTMREYNPNRIITIFGVGGGKGEAQRKNMGKLVGELSDMAIITMDNPRLDDINVINSQIESGVKETNCEYKIISDRKEAINYALSNAKENDIILIVGKGHEKYQDIQGVKYPFSEEDIIKEFIDNYGNNKDNN